MSVERATRVARVEDRSAGAWVSSAARDTRGTVQEREVFVNRVAGKQKHAIPGRFSLPAQQKSHQEVAFRLRVERATPPERKRSVRAGCVVRVYRFCKNSKNGPVASGGGKFREEPRDGTLTILDSVHSRQELHIEKNSRLPCWTIGCEHFLGQAVQSIEQLNRNE